MTRVLIVDDEPIMRQTLADLLAGEGYDLEFAADGPGGVERAMATQPDIILLDLMLPGMDGFDVCTHLRADPTLAEIPILMLTAYSERSMRLRGIGAGADDFIAKPFDGLELILRLRTLARLDRYHRLNAERERLLWAMDRSDSGYMMLNRSGRVHHANVPAHQYLGLENGDDLPGDPIKAILGSSYHMEPADVWARWPDQPFSSDAYLVRPETATSPVFWLRASEQRVTRGTTTQILLKLVDVTESITTHADMRSFRTVMTHKLRTPLNAIVGMLALLRELPDATTLGSVRDLLGDASSGAVRLHAAVEDVLTYAEGVSARGNADGVAIDTLPIIVETASTMADVECVTLDIDATVRSHKVPLSPQALEQILFELLENSRKFSPHTAPAVTISVSRDGSAIVLAVTDDGVTLAPQQIRWAMTPFLQGEKYFTGETPGMGLGLSLVSALVWQAGGTVDLHNQRNAPGVVIELRLPLG